MKTYARMRESAPPTARGHGDATIEPIADESRRSYHVAPALDSASSGENSRRAGAPSPRRLDQDLLTGVEDPNATSEPGPHEGPNSSEGASRNAGRTARRAAEKCSPVGRNGSRRDSRRTASPPSGVRWPAQRWPPAQRGTRESIDRVTPSVEGDGHASTRARSVDHDP